MKKIYIKDWLQLKPYTKQVKTDSYYLELCNNVNSAIANHTAFLSENLKILLSCFLTSYFEDIISESNIWNSFVEIHKRLYNKQIPFYDVTEYTEAEINEQDICFLVWYFMNSIQDEKIISHETVQILPLAKIVMKIFEDEWDYAPENEELKKFYILDEDEDNFINVRELFETIMFNTYLFHIDISKKLFASEQRIISSYEDKQDLGMILYDNKIGVMLESHTKLLGLSAKDWTAEIIGRDHPLSNDIMEISPRIKGFFFYKNQDNTDIFVEHIASGKQFKITKESFSRTDHFKQKNDIMYMGIVNWKNNWWLTGAQIYVPFNARLVSEQKNSFEARKEVDIIDYKEIPHTFKKHLKLQHKAFLEFNNGSQIAFLKADEVADFIDNFMEFYNNSLKISKEEMDKSEKDGLKKGLSSKLSKEDRKIFEKYDDGLAFFNPKSGVEWVFGSNSAFPISNNPFFNSDKSKLHFDRMLFDETISPEIIWFCVENFKDKLPFIANEPQKEFNDNLDFMLRFWKRDKYNTKPGISLINNI